MLNEQKIHEHIDHLSDFCDRWYEIAWSDHDSSGQLEEMSDELNIYLEENNLPTLSAEEVICHLQDMLETTERA